MATAPPGWYADPSGVAWWRWWDGRQWTGHVHPPPAPPAAMGPSGRSDPLPWRAQPLAVARLGEDQMWTWARLSVWAYALAGVTFVVLLLAAGGPLRRELHQLVGEFGNNTATQDTLNRFSGSAGWFYLYDLVAIPAAVVFLIWQHRAARVARQLGYPARVAPGLGVGSWFIPIVSLWFPYRALRDCLPEAHPSRRLGIWAWLSFLGTTACNLATMATWYFSVPWAVLPLVLYGTCWLAAAGLGTRLMGAIEEDHRRAAEVLSAELAGA